MSSQRSLTGNSLVGRRSARRNPSASCSGPAGSIRRIFSSEPHDDSPTAVIRYAWFSRQTLTVSKHSRLFQTFDEPDDVLGAELAVVIRLLPLVQPLLALHQHGEADPRPPGADLRQVEDLLGPPSP